MTVKQVDLLYCDRSLWDRYLETCREEDRAKLGRVKAALPLLADVARSDTFILFPGDPYQICVAVHAQPHSMTSLYTETPAGECYPSSERRWLWTSVTRGLRRKRIVPEVFEERPEVDQQLWPILGQSDRPLGAVAVYTNAIERERHRRRDESFQRALTRLLALVAAGEVVSPEVLPPFYEQDGIVFIDHNARYRYLSGQANNVYRRMGYLDDLRGRTLNEVAAGDQRLVQQAWETKACVVSEGVERGRILLRSAIPLFGPLDQGIWRRIRQQEAPDRVYGTLLLVQDLTESRQKAQELKVKAVMIKEIHHRVKNNLQMLVSIMRMQARRAKSEEARQLLYESVNRILSMSVIHESLSEGEAQVLNLGDVARRIVAQVQQGIMEPSRDIRLEISRADDVMLPTNRANASALVINELLLNAVEHGFRGRQAGLVRIAVKDQGDEVQIDVIDDGAGLPAEFTLASNTSLGLDIIQTLVHDDLKGTFELRSHVDGGTLANVRFPKGVSGDIRK